MYREVPDSEKCPYNSYLIVSWIVCWTFFRSINNLLVLNAGNFRVWSIITSNVIIPATPSNPSINPTFSTSKYLTLIQAKSWLSNNGNMTSRISGGHASCEKKAWRSSANERNKIHIHRVMARNTRYKMYNPTEITSYN